MPSFNFIKNTVIKPLMFATEKVVEQYIPAESTTVAEISVSNMSGYGQGA
jgi:hypothetical protein